MALPDYQGVEAGTKITFGVTGSFSPVDVATGWATSITDLITLAGVLDGEARQSDKADLGSPWAPAYQLLVAVDFTDETPVAGEVVEYYWAPSNSGTDGTANVAGNSGLDGDCPAGALGSITLAEFVKQCVFIGNLVVHDGAVVQNAPVGILVPTMQYGQLIVKNESGDVFEGDDVEMHHVLQPIRLPITDT